MRWLFCAVIMFLAQWSFGEAIVVPHGPLKAYEKNKNTLTGVATPSLGAKQSEVWHSSIEVGSETPVHTHSHEEIVILLKGKLEAVVEDKHSVCEAPCTIILPALQKHILKNVGEVPTSHYLVMPAKSTISDSTGQDMQLPWRK